MMQKWKLIHITLRRYSREQLADMFMPCKHKWLISEQTRLDFHTANVYHHALTAKISYFLKFWAEKLLCHRCCWFGEKKSNEPTEPQQTTASVHV